MLWKPTLLLPMKAKAKEFAAAISRVTRVLRTRTSLPLLTCVKLEASGGILAMTGTDLDAFASATCACEGDLPAICVDAMMLDYMIHHAVEDVELTINKQRLFISSNGTAQLSIQPAVEYPPWPDQKATALGINTADLAAAIKGVAWAADTEPKMTGDLYRESVWVKTTAKTLEACSTDGKEFSYTKQDLICAPAEFIFPAKQANLLTDALLTGAESVHLSDSWIFTKSDSFRVAVKLVSEKFVPIKLIVDQPTKPLGVFQICRLLDSLQTIKALGHGEPWLQCKLVIEPKKCTISYRGKDTHFERALEHKHEGEAFTIFMDAIRAISVFSHIQPGAKAFLGAGMILFKDDNYTYALALMTSNE